MEHPVTEQITGVNLPAAQLNVAMGIPLSRIPQIRQLYGADPFATEDIDFETTAQRPPKGHVIACRITAENPEEGFKPTSGGIQELTFRSTPNVWGYFSIQGSGGLHEFADSQFGHLFAWGNERDECRKNMIIALKELSIRGDIRTPVEYLINLLETEDFKALHPVHTGWLDLIIANPEQVQDRVDSMVAVICATAYKSYQMNKSRQTIHMKYLERGQVPPSEFLTISDKVELIYMDIKYEFIVDKFGENTYFINHKDSTIEVEVISLSDGGFLILFDGKSHLVFGKDEAMGLRLTVKGKTCIFPKDYDPSTLRSTTPGKFVRYLVANGSHVEQNTPYAEIEVMKMYMPLICTEAGVINFEIQPGTVLQGGEILATLRLDNPNAVKKSTPFTGTLPDYKPPRVLQSKPHQQLRTTIAHLTNILGGYRSSRISDLVAQLKQLLNDPILPFLEFSEILSILAGRIPSAIDQQISQLLNRYEVGLNTLDKNIHGDVKFPATSILNCIASYEKELNTPDQITQYRVSIEPVKNLAQKYVNGHLKVVITSFFEKFLDVEKLFLGGHRGEIFVSLRQKYKDNLQQIFQISLSRRELTQKGDLIVLLLSEFVEENTEAFVDILHELAGLTLKNCIEISVKARQILIRYQMPSFKQRQVAIEECLRSALTSNDNLTKIQRVYNLIDQSASLFDVLVAFFDHSNPSVRDLALEVYILRCYKAYYVDNLKTLSDNDLIRIQWEFNIPDKQVDAAQSSSAPEKIFNVESVDNLLHSVSGGVQAARYGLMVVLPTIQALYDQFEEILQVFHPQIMSIQNEPINVLNLSILQPSKENEQVLVCNVAQFFYNNSQQLRAKGMRRITLVLVTKGKFPKYYTFRERLNYQEDPVCRHVEPPLAYHLELNRLSNFDITYIPTLNRQIHLYYATTKGKIKGDPDFASCFFVRAVVRSGESINNLPVVKDYLVSQAERVMVDAIKSLEVAVRDKRFASAQNHHIFLKVITEVTYEPEDVDGLLRKLGETYGKRLWKLRVGKLELAGKVKRGNSVTSLRFTVTNPTGYDFEVDGYIEIKDNKTNTAFLHSFTGPNAPQDQRPVSEPYPLPDALQWKRFAAQNQGTTYCYDFLALYKVAVRNSWESYQATLKSRGVNVKIPNKFIEYKELVLNQEDKLSEINRSVGLNDIGMVAWRMKLFTPEAPQGREIILIANDITIQIGSFGPKEDILFKKASELARAEGIPRIYIACNSGARIGLAQEVKSKYKIKWVNEEDPTKGFKYLYLTPAEYEILSQTHSIRAELVGEDYVITDIIGKDDGLGVENLRGSGMIAGETSLAYEETFTLTQVTGRTVGIGAYLVRLGQRTIQTEAPIILTGASAINKLLGREVYSSNIQLGGLQVMFRNGVSHVNVSNDYKGTVACIQWLSYVPLKRGLQSQILDIRDPVDREIEFYPSKTPYDPVHMLAGVTNPDGHWVSGFFDQGSWTETLAGWAKTVICGRARLGGIPIGVIAVETRTVENVVPADPATPESQEQVFMQAGQVWFPDSAYKTAQAISDFNFGEELPLIIFANWRGFSGGMRDMYNEILKFGSYIVDNLRKYRHPVFIYIPPFGELRGGAWVVLDPTINIEKMEMYCDTQARGGVLEPNGTIEIKYRPKDLVVTMHRLDPVIINLKSQLKSEDQNTREQIKKQIAEREEELMPMYQQVATQFADLHDTPGRMKVKGVIRDVIQWKTARSYFYHRLKRLLLEENIRKKIVTLNPKLNNEQITPILSTAVPADVWNNDKDFVAWAENSQNLVEIFNSVQTQYLKSQISELYKLNSQLFEDVLKDIKKKK